MDVLTRPAAITTTVFGVVALFIVGLGIYWLFNKRARLRHLAELRKKLDDLRPTDPEYGAVRALYTSMVIDAERWGFLRSETGSSDDSGSAQHSGGYQDSSGGDADH